MLRALALGLLLLPLAAGADEALWALLKKGGQVVLIRHGLTDPGVGDPPGFKLEDCATQRNLSDAGRDEAKRVGEAFRERSIPVAKVLSSPWCRCVETGKIAFGGVQGTETALSNLFGRPENREKQLAQFRKLVAAAPKHGNLVLITHGSTTAAFTGVSPGTAELVIVTPDGRGRQKLAGRLALLN
jgi:broad specificity phosphatase PhoE